MSKQLSLKPILSIDLKKNRIRIHKQTLHIMGDPEYIQLLINPNNRTIAVRRTIKQDYLAHKVRLEQLGSKNCYELYSTDLVNTLCQVKSEWNKNESYRIYGVFFENEGLASFNMDDTITLNSQ